MAEDWAAIAAEVAAAIADAGFEVMLQKVTSGGPDTPWDTTAEPPRTPHTLNVLQSYVQKRDKNGTLIGNTVRTLMAEAVGSVVPEKDDTVLFADGEECIVLSVDPFSPANENLYYTIELES